MSRLRHQDSFRDDLVAAPIRLRRVIQGLCAKANTAPIFILGHQKSGTSAVAELLAELTGSSVASDLVNEDRRPTYQRVATGRMTLERFVRRNRLDFSRDIVKEPNLTFLYPQLTERFPGARFVIVVRDPRTNVKSLLERLGLPGDRTTISDRKLRSLRRGWSLAFDPSWLPISPGSYIELLAARWNLCADIYLECPESFYLVRYEDFLGSKLKSLEALAFNLGLECKHDIGPRLNTPFRPAGNHRIPVEQFFSPENLSRIERICETQMQRLGYT